MKVIIVEGPGSAVVGVVENWTGPMPGKGDYIYHPPISELQPESNVMSVKTVTYRMLTRPARGQDVGHFIEHPEPYVEICV